MVGELVAKRALIAKGVTKTSSYDRGGYHLHRAASPPWPLAAREAGLDF